jgi:hypothetical protein
VSNETELVPVFVILVALLVIKEKCESSLEDGTGYPLGLAFLQHS